jgi:hypothetical protein
MESMTFSALYAAEHLLFHRDGALLAQRFDLSRRRIDVVV